MSCSSVVAMTTSCINFGRGLWLLHVCVTVCLQTLEDLLSRCLHTLAVLADFRTLARSHLRPVSAQPCTSHQWHHRHIPSRRHGHKCEAQLVSCYEGSSRVWAGQFWACQAQLQCQSCQYNICQYHCERSGCWSQKEATVNALQCY